MGLCAVKRICCYCDRWESGGIESFLNNVLNRLDLREVEVDIVTADLRQSVFTAGLEQKGIHFYQLSGSQQKLRQNWRMFRQLLEQRHYDVIHFNLFQGLSLYYARLAQKAGVPVRIVHSHNTALRPSRTRPLKLLLHRTGKRLFLRSATDLWACSTPAAEFLFSRKIAREGQFRFIPNGIETERFRFDPAQREAVRRALGLEEEFVIGNVGRLCAQKNQEFLLDVFAEVVKQKPESRLLLVGTGELEPALKARAKALQVADKVIFYGVSDRVETLLWAMDVFAFPSVYEGLPVSLVEAQTAGLPCCISNNISRETALIDLVEFIPLENGAAAWAEVLVHSGAAEKPQDTWRQVRAAGFDVEDVARKIERYYLRSTDR